MAAVVKNHLPSSAELRGFQPEFVDSADEVAQVVRNDLAQDLVDLSLVAVDRIHQLADAVLRNWPEEHLEGVPPIEVRNAVREVQDASSRGEEVLSVALENFIAIVPDALRQDVPRGGEALGVLLRGLYSIARQHQHSPRPVVQASA
jgi:hypothetical protein